MNLIDPRERRLLHVERGLDALDRDIRNLKRQTIALWQGLWDDAGTIEKRVPTPTGPPPTNETFTLHINGCITGNKGAVGATVTIALSGTTLYTGALDSSSSLTDSFYSPTPGVNTYTWTVTPVISPVRQSTLTFTSSTAGTITQSLSAATGFFCMNLLNQLPPKANLRCVDSSAVSGSGGTMTLTRTTGSTLWFRTVGAHQYWLDQSGQFFVDSVSIPRTSATWTDSGALNVVYTVAAGQATSVHPTGTTFVLSEP